MKIKIVSDGTAAGTSVINASTGEPVEGCSHVSFVAQPGGAPDALLHITGVECDIVVDASTNAWLEVQDQGEFVEEPSWLTNLLKSHREQ